MYWPPFQAKSKATCSMPDLENQLQQAVNDFWSCMMVTQSARWVLMAIYEGLTGFIDPNVLDH